LSSQQLLYDDTGRLKPGWRIVVFSITTILSLLVSAMLVGPLLAGFFGLLGFVFASIGGVLLTVSISRSNKADRERKS